MRLGAAKGWRLRSAQAPGARALALAALASLLGLLAVLLLARRAGPSGRPGSSLAAAAPPLNYSQLMALLQPVGSLNAPEASQASMPAAGSRRVVSMSLFSKQAEPQVDDMYVAGLFLGLQLARTTLPQWQLRLYLAQPLLPRLGPLLAQLPVHVVVMPFDPRHWELGMFWRFLVEEDPSVDLYIIRDSDSRIWARDLHTIEAFVASGRPFYCVHDHIDHNREILGGMWGARRGTLHRAINASLQDWIWQWTRTRQPIDRKGMDQDFVSQAIWPYVKDAALNLVGPGLQHMCYGAADCRVMPAHWAQYDVDSIPPPTPWDYMGRICAPDETYVCAKDDPHRCHPIRGVDWRRLFKNRA